MEELGGEGREEGGGEGVGAPFNVLPPGATDLVAPLGHSPLPRSLPQWGEGHPSPHPTPPLGALGASILTPPILKFCLRYWRASRRIGPVPRGGSYSDACEQGH